MSSAGSHLSKEFFELVKSIGESRSKQEEDRIICNEIEILKQRLLIPNATPRKKKEYLIRAMYVEMLGHDASFAYVYAVKLANEKHLLCKRVGYLACNAFLSEDHELMLLLINTIQRDLSSVNHLEVSAALTCVCQLLNREMYPAIEPSVRKLIEHPNEVVRKKACIAVQRLYSVNPACLPDFAIPLKRALCDPEPSVMCASLYPLHELARISPTNCKELVPSIVAVLRQICEQRLAREYDYHRMPAPWIQVKLLAFLATVGKDDPKASDQMYETLHEVMRKAEIGANMAYAVTYECIKTIATIYPSKTLTEVAALSISRFIGSENRNLRYVGITSLGWIVRANPSTAAHHQLTVVDCLEDFDDTLRRKTLDLLFYMTNPKNVVVIVSRLLSHLKVSSDKHLSKDLATKITDLAERFAPNNEWYVQALMDVFEVAGDWLDSQIGFRLIQLIAEGPCDDEEANLAFRRGTVNKMIRVFERLTPTTTLLSQVAAWSVGEFGTLNTVEGYESPADLLRLLSRFLSRQGETDEAREWVVVAIGKLCARLGGAILEEIEDLLASQQSSQDLCLRSKSLELQKILRLPPEALTYLLPQDGACEDIDLTEWTALDEYTADETQEFLIGDLEPTGIMESELCSDVTGSEKPKLNFTPYEAPRCSECPSSKPEIRLSLDALKLQDEFSPPKTGFNVQGPRLWGPEGYAKKSASEETMQPQHRTDNTINNDIVNDRKKQPPPPPRKKTLDTLKKETLILTEKEKAAAALFCGLTTDPRSNPLETQNTATSSNLSKDINLLDFDFEPSLTFHPLVIDVIEAGSAWVSLVCEERVELEGVFDDCGSVTSWLVENARWHVIDESEEEAFMGTATTNDERVLLRVYFDDDSKSSLFHLKGTTPQLVEKIRTELVRIGASSRLNFV